MNRCLYPPSKHAYFRKQITGVALNPKNILNPDPETVNLRPNSRELQYRGQLSSYSKSGAIRGRTQQSCDCDEDYYDDEQHVHDDDDDDKEHDATSDCSNESAPIVVACSCICAHLSMDVCARVHVCLNACSGLSVCVHVRVGEYMGYTLNEHTHTHIYIYIYTYMYTYIHITSIYICTYSQTHLPCRYYCCYHAR